MKKIIIITLKIIATIILSAMIIIGIIGFFPIVEEHKDNVMLDAIIPMACYTTFCFAGIVAMWKGLRSYIGF